MRKTYRFITGAMGWAVKLAFFLFAAFMIIAMNAPSLEGAFAVITGDVLIMLGVVAAFALLLWRVVVTKRPAPSRSKSLRPSAKRSFAAPPVVEVGTSRLHHAPPSLSDDLADYVNEALRK